MKTIILESFYTGSHKLWADNLKRASDASTSLMTLPGKHWKWRMHSAAVSFAKLIIDSGEIPDRIIASSLIDLVCLKGLLFNHLEMCHFVLYMHENQICYPWSPKDKDVSEKKDHHYGFINFTSCLAADEIQFNSAYHKKVFLEALPAFLKMYPDKKNLDTVTSIEAKCKVAYIPLDLSEFYMDAKHAARPPIILWNHRWEYDKGPEEFFQTLIDLAEEGVEFSLMVLGESYARYPGIFDTARIALSDKIVSWGFCENRNDYVKNLRSAHILPVTSRQEFFGISVVEAIAAGCIPLLPDRLSYPELLGSQHSKNLYQEGEFKDRLAQVISSYRYDRSLMDSIHRFDAFS